MTTQTVSSVSQQRTVGGFFFGGFVLAVGMSMLYLGGWSPFLGQTLPLDTGAFVIASHGFAVQVNGVYYGAFFATRVFDVPLLSWALFFPGLAFCIGACGVILGKRIPID